MNRWIILLFISCFTCNTKEIDFRYTDYNHNLVNYKFYSPHKKIRLHWDLEEISGLAYFKNGVLGAIEDERGKLYLLDSADGKIKRTIKFEKGGDYEGIEFIQETAFIIKSNGNLYSFQVSDDDQVASQKRETAFTSQNDVEGLGSLNNQLLIACKREGNIKGVNRKGKGIYILTDNGPEPFIFVKQEDLDSFIDKKPHFNKFNDFDPSGIAVNPLNQDIYILSADRVIVVYDQNKQLKEVIKLSTRLFTQPEGICFSPNGTLFLSSEGDGDKGELFVFHPLAGDN